jgi:thiol-disulfide isomerase/thioredoxin
MQAIAPLYEELASQHPNAVFLKVDVDKHKAIAAKYQVTAMPTFLVIKESGVADMVRGANRPGLAAMVSSHTSAAAPSGSSQPTDAEKAKIDGNAAFAAGQYAKAVDHYSRAIKLAPRSAVLHGNRAFAYIKLIQSSDTPKKERQALRPKALQDAQNATTFDEGWAKGWIRMAEALLLAGDEEAMESTPAAKRAEGRMATLEGAQKALENAIGLSDGNVRAGGYSVAC